MDTHFSPSMTVLPTLKEIELENDQSPSTDYPIIPNLQILAKDI